ncbi:MAG: endonuclease/exonuclease/phosphatase family protein [Nocardioides sp.]|nr:endonuclease/exonuclease/phosphatase family protein [Nocardioides sp.]
MNDDSSVPAGESSPVDNRLVLLQYNTHLFEGSQAIIGAKLKGVWGDAERFFTGSRIEPMDPLLFADEQRRLGIASWVRRSDADLVALNEVWSDENMEWVARELRDVYPYHAFGPKSSQFAVGSGLVLLSKYKIDASSIYIYDRDRDTLLGTKMANPFDSGEDDWANKGVLVAVITGPDEKKIVVSLSHTAGLVDIRQLVDQTRVLATGLSADDYALIVAGDLNVHRSQRETLKAEMERVDARDSWTEVNGDRECETIDFPSNKLDQVFSPRRIPNPHDEMQVDQLDFVFYRPSTHPSSVPLKPVEAHVPKDWVFPLEHGYHQDLMRARWMSNYVAVRSFELNGHPYLFGLKQGNDRAYVSRIRDNGSGWDELGSWEWQSHCLGSAVRTFQLDGHPYVFALNRGDDRASISRIRDDGRGWDDLGSWRWQSNYVAVVPFYLHGHPHLFALKQGNDRAYISRIRDDGRGWDDLGSWKWQSSYVPDAITTFELAGHPYVFALKQGNDRAYISRIRDDGRGWDDLGSWRWQSNYVAVVSYQLGGHPYLFGLKSTGEAFISRINDDGRGWVDVEKTKWSANYVGAAITPFYLSGEAHLFALKRNDEGWITKLTEPGTTEIELSDHYPMTVVFGW